MRRISGEKQYRYWMFHKPSFMGFEVSVRKQKRRPLRGRLANAKSASLMPITCHEGVVIGKQSRLL